MRNLFELWLIHAEKSFKMPPLMKSNILVTDLASGVPLPLASRYDQELQTNKENGYDSKHSALEDIIVVYNSCDLDVVNTSEDQLFLFELKMKQRKEQRNQVRISELRTSLRKALKEKDDLLLEVDTLKLSYETLEAKYEQLLKNHDNREDEALPCIRFNEKVLIAKLQTACQQIQIWKDRAYLMKSQKKKYRTHCKHLHRVIRCCPTCRLNVKTEIPGNQQKHKIENIAHVALGPSSSHDSFVGSSFLLTNPNDEEEESDDDDDDDARSQPSQGNASLMSQGEEMVMSQEDQSETDQALDKQILPEDDVPQISFDEKCNILPPCDDCSQVSKDGTGIFPSCTSQVSTAETSQISFTNKSYFSTTDSSQISQDTPRYYIHGNGPQLINPPKHGAMGPYSAMDRLVEMAKLPGNLLPELPLTPQSTVKPQSSTDASLTCTTQPTTCDGSINFGGTSADADAETEMQSQSCASSYKQAKERIKTRRKRRANLTDSPASPVGGGLLEYKQHSIELMPSDETSFYDGSTITSDSSMKLEFLCKDKRIQFVIISNSDPDNSILKIQRDGRSI